MPRESRDVTCRAAADDDQVMRERFIHAPHYAACGAKSQFRSNGDNAVAPGAGIRMGFSGLW
ncbi:hypothetical protein QQ056_14625 [Oscillatoria laete-virens NRMC-F 0139]|nr:hypothetical protein [Oscillatoria laete-virens]MDL5054771.1 hypothetical protein [Oscillatoria laete-virens NRMC-F 0139]